MKQRIWINWTISSAWSVQKDKVLKILYIDLGRLSIEVDYGKEVYL